MPAMSKSDHDTLIAAGLRETTIGKFGLKSLTAAETVTIFNGLKAANALKNLSAAMIDEIMGQIADILPRIAG